MAISDKARKALWGRSGNRCAMCRRELVVQHTQVDEEAVVGEECHIVSGQPSGPRFTQGLPVERIHSLENIILLCRVDHKLVDDQHETYTAELLQQIKVNHERWVATTLSEDKKQVPPTRIRRLKQNIPTHLVRVTNGKELLAIVEGACAYSLDHDDLETEEQVALVGGFLEEARDWGELSGDLEPSDRVRATFRLTQAVEGLERRGFLVFGARETQRLEGGVGAPSNWPVSILQVLRDTNPEIIRREPRPEGVAGDEVAS